MSCKHYDFVLIQSDRHFIDSPKHNNCVLCLVKDKGPMTQEEVSKYLGISKMRVSQIERKAIKRLKKKTFQFFSENPLLDN